MIYDYFGAITLIVVSTVLGIGGMYVSCRPTSTREEQDKLSRGESAKQFLVRADWDEEACVWSARSDDVPGLGTQSSTIEALHTKLKDLVPFLLEANGRVADLATPLELVAHRFSLPGTAEDCHDK